MKYFLIILSMVLTNPAIAQILQWTPLFSTIDDTITITYDATKGNASLVGASQVYAHTGVLTEDSTNPSDWHYVIAGWTENIPRAQMTPLGDDKWQLRFHIKSYYGLPSNARVTHLAFVFRNPDGSRTGRAADGGDIFLPIYAGGLDLSIVSPPSYHNILQPGDSVKIVAIASNAQKIDLFIDEKLIKSSITDTLVYHTSPIDFTKHRAKIFATDSATLTTKVDSFYYLLRPDPTVAALPSNVQNGINYDTDDITLVLHAPFKEFVYLMGDWNNWEADPDFYLNKTPDAEHFWIKLEQQPQNTAYRYQFWVDGELRIADPYAELVLDPQNDQFIPEATFPNMPPYPHDKTKNIVSVLNTTPEAFDWQAEDYVRPAQENLIIYEVLLRDFLRDHDFKTLTDTLDYFVDLGVNAIELMPFNEFEGNLSWGYNPSFYFAPDKYYGRKQDVQRFIDEAHKRGIAVIQDIVLNHTYGQSPMVRLYSEDLSQSPWYNVTSPNPVFSWGYDFDHESPATQGFVDRVTEFWLTEYRVDGFRFDFTKGFTNRGGDGYARDNSRIALLKRMADAMWLVDPTAYVILEHFTENSEERELAAYGMLLWGNLNYNYNEATMGYHEDGKSDFSWGVYKRRGWNSPHLITYMESHDEERLMYKNKQYGNSSGSYNIKQEKIALERIELAATFFFTIPGPKMIWQFGELGYDYSINYNGRLGEKPIRWDYLYETNRRKLRDVFSALMHLKKKHATFSSPDFTTSFGGSVKWMSIDHDSMNAMIVGNFDVVRRTREFTFQHAGWWYDYFSGDSIFVENNQFSINLNPGVYHLFTDQKLQTPLITHIDAPAQAPHSNVLLQNYPNPFNGKTTITFELAAASNVELKVYNIHGQEILSLIEGKRPAGAHRISWDSRDKQGRRVSSGVYLSRLTTDGFSHTRKMLLVQ